MLKTLGQTRARMMVILRPFCSQSNLLFSGQKETGSILTVARNILEKEGFQQFWRGNGVNCVRVFPYAATQFVSYEKYKGLVQSKLSSGGDFGMKER